MSRDSVLHTQFERRTVDVLGRRCERSPMTAFRLAMLDVWQESRRSSRRAPRIGVVLLLSELSRGGAQRQAVELARGLARIDVDVTVVVFRGGHAFDHEACVPGVRFVDLRGRGGRPGAVWRLVRLARRHRPAVIYGFLEIPNVVGLIAARLSGARCAFGVRAIDLDRSALRPWSRFIYRVEAIAARFADVVVANSDAAAADVIARGARAERVMTVPNGIDSTRYVPDRERGAAFREAHGLRDDAIVVGRVGRIDPVKDLSSFLRAGASMLADGCVDDLLIVGGGDERLIGSLRQEAHDLGIAEHVTWVGEIDDVTGAYNACTITISSSIEESCPNVVAESMSCGTPAVVTDVGASRDLVGTIGRVVAPRDPNALAQAGCELARQVAVDGASLTNRARAHIHDHYGLDVMVRSTCAAIGVGG